MSEELANKILESAALENWTVGKIADECFKQGLLRAAEICDEQKEEYENGQPISLRYTCAEAIRVEAEK